MAINCAAIPEQLIESELFGHERGAFTGAARDRAGLFEAASGGTLFLDEVASMSLAFQQKVLRVVEYGVLTRVGGTEEIASVSDSGVPSDAASAIADISADGRYVAFESRSTNLDPADSERLAQGAEALVAYLDSAGEAYA